MRKGANAKPKQASRARIATPAKTRPAAGANTTDTSRKSAAAGARLVLDPECTLRDGASLKARLLAAGDGGITLEGGAVERIDTAALQLLVALARREAAAGRQLAWASASAPLLAAGARLGLLEVLALPAGAESP